MNKHEYARGRPVLYWAQVDLAARLGIRVGTDYEGRHRLPEVEVYRELPPGTVFLRFDGEWGRRRPIDWPPYTEVL
ncbi:hypothetical protein OPTIMUS_114 [Mycobacterium phage Optimus]|uniref:Uncharacterized protein n=3 Tax=Omegavirus TaxID=1623292 RepID=A0A3S9UAW8_9CAUD|nr:hypothetical protein VC71_gp121 [Mycobacterium phage Minerva]YP_009590970.1 hypothetical protein FDG54_gp114 [Mycobacterium phage Optimus]YP_009636294.1 hypothetical protein FGG20_gp123 [Mycobacterium phage Baka]AXQ52348.1 hypothetical protein SEA_ERICMILLARD_115 [Mycobacterium phage EricMillard]AXQ62525.1 hypothetical protein SEA_ZELINK_118 [Mycobacterium phage Zelink]AZS07457.1 hypothetical protein PBI_DUKE13_118 [Mycobacterium phage Duke13]QBI97567.1 hypothetical protein SEA_HUGHESYANG_